MARGYCRWQGPVAVTPASKPWEVSEWAFLESKKMDLVGAVAQKGTIFSGVGTEAEQHPERETL